MNSTNSQYYATISDRLASYIVDQVILRLIFFTAFYIVFLVGNYLIDMSLLAILVVIGFLYEPVLICLYGKTVGNIVTKTNIKDEKSNLLKFKYCILREIIFIPNLIIRSFFSYKLLDSINNNDRNLTSLKVAITHITEQFPALSFLSGFVFAISIFTLSSVYAFSNRKKQALHDIFGKSIVTKFNNQRSSWMISVISAIAISVSTFLHFFGNQAVFIVKFNGVTTQRKSLNFELKKHEIKNISASNDTVLFENGQFKVHFRTKSRELKNKNYLYTGSRNESITVFSPEIETNLFYKNLINQKQSEIQGGNNISKLGYLFDDEKVGNDVELLYEIIKINPSDLKITDSMGLLKKKSMILELKSTVATFCTGENVLFLKSNDTDAVQFGIPGNASGCIYMIISKKSKSIQILMKPSTLFTQENLNLIVESYIPKP